jgi:outer membrane protein assembly factor BamB
MSFTFLRRRMVTRFILTTLVCLALSGVCWGQAEEMAAAEIPATGKTVPSGDVLRDVPIATDFDVSYPIATGRYSKQTIVIASGANWVYNADTAEYNLGESTYLVKAINDKDGSVAWTYTLPVKAGFILYVQNCLFKGSKLYILGLTYSPDAAGTTTFITTLNLAKKGAVIWSQEYPFVTDIYEYYFQMILSGGKLYLLGGSESETSSNLLLTMVDAAKGTLIWKNTYPPQLDQNYWNILGISVVGSKLYLTVSETESGDTPTPKTTIREMVISLAPKKVG